jgi:lysophospholipase L1-like esterase
MARPRRRVRTSLRFRLLGSAGVLLGALLVGEGAARAVGPTALQFRGGDPGSTLMVAHPTRLWALGPGERQNAGATATIAPNGLRGEVPAGPRRANEERVIVLGDSSFFGHGLADAATIPVQLESRLRAAGVEATVINGATPGYSTEQSLRLLDEVGWSLEPTLLLVCNLWSDNNTDGFRDRDLLHTADAYRENPLMHSALFGWVAGWVDRARGGEGARLVTWTKTSEWPEARERRVPLQDYARNLDGIARAARERGAGVAFLAPANQGLVDGRFQEGGGWDPYFAAQAAVAAWHGAPVVSMRKALQDDGLPTADDFVDVMHPSAAGAAAVAAAAADTLRAAGWPEARLLARDTPFDASSLVDDRRFASGGQPPQYSPQAQLFDLSLPARTPGDGDPGAREPATPGDPPAPPTPPR